MSVIFVFKDGIVTGPPLSPLEFFLLVLRSLAIVYEVIFD